MLIFISNQDTYHKLWPTKYFGLICIDI